MVKLNGYYKLVNGFEIWMKIINETSDKYDVEYQVYHKDDEKYGHGTGNFTKGFLDSRESTGELKELSKDEIIIFNLG